jgi:hypothetical protein
MEFTFVQHFLNNEMILEWRAHSAGALTSSGSQASLRCKHQIAYVRGNRSLAININFGIIVLATLLVITLLLQLPTPTIAAEQGWVLTQRSRQLGDQYVYLSGDGLKCINPKQGIGLVTQAPNWHIEVFNNRTRLYYSLTLDAWKKKLTARANLPANIAWNKAEAANIAGLRATHYVMRRNGSTGQGTKWLAADYWVADDIRVPPQLANMLSTVYGLPTMQFVPLRLAYTDPNGNVETILDTYQQQSTALPASYFVVPSNCTPAKNEMEVMVSNENRHLINDIAHDLEKDPSAQGLNSNSIPANGVTLPNGRTVSKQDISKYLNAFKQRVRVNNN